jgi:hypothetical protein
MGQFFCPSYCRQLKAVSFNTGHHVALYRSIYRLFSWSSLRTLLGYLCAFANYWRATVSFVIYDRPYVRMEQLTFHWNVVLCNLMVYQFSNVCLEHLIFIKF